MSNRKFFVYGTLKMGGRFSEVYKKTFDPNRIKVIDGCKIKGKLFNLGSFPGVKIDDDGSEVTGEVHEFKNAERITEIFDRIEGYNERSPEGGLYNRVEVDVSLPDGKTDRATVYTYNGNVSGRSEVETGIWELGG